MNICIGCEQFPCVDVSHQVLGSLPGEERPCLTSTFRKKTPVIVHCDIDSDERPSYNFLCEVNRRPEPFAEYTARELWTDPHISQKMLAFHLDPTIDAASRNREFLDRSADWIVSHFGLSPMSSVADFGCGPGLYAQRLARKGANVTGIDFSANSLRYARDEAVREGLQIEYVQADYLDFHTERRFDLIIMIMCDFCALSPEQRHVLLRTFRTLLAPNGKILLDVYSLAMLDTRHESAIYAPDLMDGFWSSEPYFGFLNTFKYERERVLLDKYTIVERRSHPPGVQLASVLQPRSARRRVHRLRATGRGTVGRRCREPVLPQRG